MNQKALLTMLAAARSASIRGSFLPFVHLTESRTSFSGAPIRSDLGHATGSN